MAIIGPAVGANVRRGLEASHHPRRPERGGRAADRGRIWGIRCISLQCLQAVEMATKNLATYGVGHQEKMHLTMLRAELDNTLGTGGGPELSRETASTTVEFEPHRRHQLWGDGVLDVTQELQPRRRTRARGSGAALAAPGSSQRPYPAGHVCARDCGPRVTEPIASRGSCCASAPEQVLQYFSR